MTDKELIQLIQAKKLKDYTFKCLLSNFIVKVGVCDMEINHQDKTVEIF